MTVRSRSAEHSGDISLLGTYGLRRAPRMLSWAALPAVIFLAGCGAATHQPATVSAGAVVAPTPLASASTHFVRQVPERASAASLVPPPTKAPRVAVVGTSPEAVPACSTKGLTAQLGPQQGAAGHLYLSLLLQNHTTGSCELQGYPGLSFTAGSDAHQIGSAAERDHRYPARQLVLAPGASAHTVVSIAVAGVYDSQRCQLVQATGLRIYPPGST